MKIKARENLYGQFFDAVHIYKPLDLNGTFTVEFVFVVRKNQPIIIHSLSEGMLFKITEDHQDLLAAVASETTRARAFEASKHCSFNKLWSIGGQLFESFRVF